MAGVNKVILVGNLGADPEARSLNNGGEVVNMRVATSESWKDRDGNRQERTEWHNVVIFNENLGQVAKSYLQQGLARSISKARSRPASGRTSRATTATRPKSCCSASAASWSCSTAAKAASGGGFGGGGGGDDFGGGFGGRSGGGGSKPAVASAAGGVRHRPGRRRSVLGCRPASPGPAFP